MVAPAACPLTETSAALFTAMVCAVPELLMLTLLPADPVPPSSATLPPFTVIVCVASADAWLIPALLPPPAPVPPVTWMPPAPVVMPCAVVPLLIMKAPFPLKPVPPWRLIPRAEMVCDPLPSLTMFALDPTPPAVPPLSWIVPLFAIIVCAPVVARNCALFAVAPPVSVTLPDRVAFMSAPWTCVNALTDARDRFTPVNVTSPALVRLAS